MNFYIRLKFALKTASTNFQNISDKKKNLISLTIKLKINIKRHDDVITTSNDRLENFKNVRRKFFKKKKENKAQSANEKFKREKKNRKKKQNYFLRLFVILVKKKHYASNCFQFSKNAKMKTDVNVVETTEKKSFLKKTEQNFRNNK